MKKVLFLIFASLLVLGACSQEKPEKKNENKQVDHKKSNDPKKNKRSDDKKKIKKNYKLTKITINKMSK